MNETIRHQLDHRTIRFFKDEPVEHATLDSLWAVMNQTATSNGLQLASIIRLTDPTKKQALAKICKQDYVANAPELYVFIADIRRVAQIAYEKGGDLASGESNDLFIKGLTDACLMAQNLTNAVESLGLGAVYLGSILNDPAALIELLQLPPLTMPILGVGFGYADDTPQLKPRMDWQFKMHENVYQDTPSYLEALADYDRVMTDYYDTRDKNQRSDTYTNQVAKQLANPNKLRQRYMQLVEEQGFDLNI